MVLYRAVLTGRSALKMGTGSSWQGHGYRARLRDDLLPDPEGGAPIHAVAGARPDLSDDELDAVVDEVAAAIGE